MDEPLNRRELVAWCAGFIDGEGSVGIAKRKGGKSHVMRLSAGQVKREPLDRLSQTLGGGVYYRPPARYLGWHLWVIEGLKASIALAELLPYLVNKQPVAEIALEFQAGIDTRKRGRAFVVGAAELARRENCRLRIMALNAGNGKQQQHIPETPEREAARTERIRATSKAFYAANKERWAPGGRYNQKERPAE